MGHTKLYLRCMLVSLSLAAAPARAAEPPLAVTAAPAQALFVPVTRSAPATATAIRRTRLAARLAAPIERFLVEVGDRIEAGAAVARLECVDAADARDAARARLGEATAQARLARLQLERVRRLRAGDAVSAEELDRAEAEHTARTESVTVRRTDLGRAQRDVARCTVMAPAAGIITARHRSAGDFVTPGTVLVTLVGPDDLEVSASVPSGDGDSLVGAQEIEFRAHDRRYPLQRPRRTGVIDPASRTEEFRLQLGQERPLPGQSGRVHWRSARNALPADLLVQRDGRLGVFTVEDGRARFHPLDGAVEGRPAMTNLAADTRILVEGRFAAVDGLPVEIVE